MKPVSRLTRSSDFKAVYKLGKSFVNRFVVLYVRRVDPPEKSKAGFVVGRNFGKAVARNRAKRLLREAYRLNSTHIPVGYHLVFVARSALRGAKLSTAEPAVVDVLHRSGVLSR